MADLITLASYKEAEGLSTPKEDLRINALIPSVSQLVKTYCGNSIVDFTLQIKRKSLTLIGALM